VALCQDGGGIVPQVECGIAPQDERDIVPQVGDATSPTGDWKMTSRRRPQVGNCEGCGTTMPTKQAVAWRVEDGAKSQQWHAKP
jgi:hypothetical protein